MEEAQDIDIYLKPMSGHFESLETTEFDECGALFDPMFHGICLLWANSKFYCRPARIIILLQEMNNLVMRRANEYLEPIDLFKGEPEESVEKINVCCGVLQKYQACYEAHKERVLGFFKNGLPPRDWEFSRHMVFARWDKFMERMNMIKVSLV